MQKPKYIESLRGGRAYVAHRRARCKAAVKNRRMASGESSGRMGRKEGDPT